MNFMDHLQFNLHAAAIGEVTDLKDLSKLDFLVTARFEQDIIQHLVAQINTMLLAAKHSMDESFDEANATLTKANDAFKASIDKAQADLDAQKAVWDKKNSEAQAEADQKKAEIAAEGLKRQQDVGATKQKFDALIFGLEADMTSAEQHMNEEIAKAEKTVADTKAEWDGKIDSAKKIMTNAQAALVRDCGDVDQALNNAIARAQSAEDSLSSLNDDVNRAQEAYNNAGWFAKVGKMAMLSGLKVEKIAKETTAEIAKGILEGAKAIVDGAAYSAAHGLLSDATSALDFVRTESDKALNEVNVMCEGVRNVETALFEKAKNALELARTSSAELGFWNAAKELLRVYNSTEVSLYGAVSYTLDHLEACAEKLAYDMAVVALAVAKANTHDIDVAKHAIDTVKDGADAFVGVAQYMVAKAGDFVDIESVDLSGLLRGMVDKTDGGQDGWCAVRGRG
jgi:hypothetical protein